MNRRTFFFSACTGALSFADVIRLAGQAKTITPDLGGLADRPGAASGSRRVTRLVDGARRGVQLSAAPGEAVALLPGVELTAGTIELDIRGKDVPQQSFLGVAFHGADTSTHDAVYFRPFNFRATDPMSHSHAVQYHSTPGNGWEKLRTEQPGKFEQAVNPVPDPNGWFHARIVIAASTVSVFVEGATTPSLSVPLLNDRKKGLVGLWVGNNSGGDFANLTITPS